MSFPFSVRFSKPLKAVVTPEHKESILQYIEKSIFERNADNVVVNEISVRYKGSTSYSNTAIFRGVDNGMFCLVKKNDNWCLEYTIDMHSLFIYPLIMSLIFGIIATIESGMWWIGIIGYTWLCGGNWVINFIRHGSLASNIAYGIDQLLCDKEEEAQEEDKMTGPLKSWF